MYTLHYILMKILEILHFTAHIKYFKISNVKLNLPNSQHYHLAGIFTRIFLQLQCHRILFNLVSLLQMVSMMTTDICSQN